MLEQAVSTKERNVFGFSVRCVYSFFRESLRRVSCSVIAGSKYSRAATHRQSRGALPRHPQAIGLLDVSPPLATAACCFVHVFRGTLQNEKGRDVHAVCELNTTHNCGEATFAPLRLTRSVKGHA